MNWGFDVVPSNEEWNAFVLELAGRAGDSTGRTRDLAGGAASQCRYRPHLRTEIESGQPRVGEADVARRDQSTNRARDIQIRPSAESD
jgi:hypothetical protein